MNSWIINNVNQIPLAGTYLLHLFSEQMLFDVLSSDSIRYNQLFGNLLLFGGFGRSIGNALYEMLYQNKLPRGLLMI